MVINKILCAGTVPATGLGDALQQVVSTLLIHKNFPQAEVILSVPNIGISRPILVPALSIKDIDKTKIKLMHGLYEQSALTYLLRAQRASPTTSISPMYGYHVLKYIPLPLATLVYDFFRPAVCYLGMPKYDAGFIAGHTIEAGAFTLHITTYNCARAIVKGPLITFPISVSLIGLKKNSRFLHILTKALNKIDMIFVRGKFSYKILSKIIKSESKQKLEIALDSGFGIRLLYPNTNKRAQNAHEFTVGIVPRKDYFNLYNRPYLYIEYLRSLKLLIENIITKFDVKVLLIPHSLRLKNAYKHFDESDESVVETLVNLLDENFRKRVKIVRPSNVIESIGVLSSLNTIITSRMHAGIIALAYGIPSIFFMPQEDIKVLDVLSILNLEPNKYFVDSFNPKEYSKLRKSVELILDNLTQETKSINRSVEKNILTVEKPCKFLMSLPM